MTGGFSLAIVQGYIPEYRLSFFSNLADKLRVAGIKLVVVAGSPTGRQASRRDAVNTAPWLRHVEPYRITVGGRVLSFYGTAEHWSDCAGVIFTLRLNSIDYDLELLKRPVSGRKIGAWGHVKAYNRPVRRYTRFLELWKMRACDHLFAYTNSGADFALSCGMSAARVTSVMNSTDLSETFECANLLEEYQVQQFESMHNLVPEKTFGYIGAMDTVKRIDFLAKALDVLWLEDPEIKLVAGGRGDQEEWLAAAMDRGQVVHVGYATSREKALICRVSRALLHPGPLGLIAVEALAFGIPILTVAGNLHGPEYEYLSEGSDVFVSTGGSAAFADLVLEFAQMPLRSSNPRPYPSLNDMVDNFASGVSKMMLR